MRASCAGGWMLEYAGLCFLPWVEEAERGTWVRSVLDAAGRTPLGVVRGTLTARTWYSWFPACRLEVLETSDEALLLSLLRARGIVRVWDFYDADDNRIGSFYPPVLLDRDGVRQGYLEMQGTEQ